MSNHLWLPNTIKKKSPNFDNRTSDEVSLLVIHNISLPPNKFGGDWISDFFLNQLDISADPAFQEIATLQVSAHFLIRREGQIIQFVALNKRAWHAGVSSFKGREACNDYSIGIELEGTDEIPYTPIQYQQLAVLTQQIMTLYPEIIPQRIVGHCDIAPQRKTDPGQSFDWTHYFTLLKV